MRILDNPYYAQAVYVTYYYPFLMTVAFLIGLVTTKIPAKGRFVLCGLGALIVALFLAHMNRIFRFWPAHLYFASGHMTMSLGMAILLGLLRPWTLAVTLPLLIPFGYALVVLHFHRPVDVLGAVLIVTVVYGLVDRFWGLVPRARVPRKEASTPMVSPGEGVQA